jgi:hypothetical protein
MLAHHIRPPSGLGGHIDDAAAPFRRPHGLAILAVQHDAALIGIEVGYGAQQQRLAGARRATDGDALPRRQAEGRRREADAMQVGDFKWTAPAE